jgi:hypothetical protein
MGTPPDDATQKPSQDTTPADRKRFSWKWLNNAAVGAALGALIGVFAYPIYHHLFPGPPPAPYLQEYPITVQSYSPTRPGPETVDFLLFNAGNANTLITSASVEVQQFMRLPEQSFIYDSYIAPGHRYDVPTPFRASAGQVIPAPLFEFVDVHLPERFDMRFRLPGAVSGYVYLYRVQVSLRYSGQTTHPVELLLSLPRDPSGAGSNCSSYPQLCGFLRLSGNRDAVLTQLTP